LSCSDRASPGWIAVPVRVWFQEFVPFVTERETLQMPEMDPPWFSTRRSMEWAYEFEVSGVIDRSDIVRSGRRAKGASFGTPTTTSIQESLVEAT